MSVLTKEETPRDYLRPSRSGLDGARVTPSDRTAIVDWLYGIATDGRLDFEPVVAAMGLVDRFLSRPGDLARAARRDRRQFRRVALAALSLCLRADPPTDPGRDVLARWTTHSVREIEDAEAHLRRGLTAADLHAPTSLQAARRLLAVAFPGVDLDASRWSCVLDDVRFQLEFAVRDYYFALRRPRTVAMAAILNAFDDVTGPDRQVLCRVVPVLMAAHFPSRAAVIDLRAAQARLRAVMGRDEPAEEGAVVSDEE